MGGSGGLLEGFLEKGQLPFLIEVQLIYTGNSDSKESACKRPGPTPGLGISGEEKGNPLQYSCLENSTN